MQTQILEACPEQLQILVECLRSGEVIAMPTETVYGLAGHAFDDQAVARIFAVKERPSFDPLIVHLADRQWNLERLVAAELIVREAIPEALQAPLEALMRAFWPGPLTLVLPKAERVPDLVSSGLATVALRVPAHPVAQALLRESFPLAAPSANRFGRISPTSAAAVLAELSGRIPYILEGGPCEIGLESTVLGLEGESLTLLRPGGLSPEAIEAELGQPLLRPAVHPAEVLAPGMLKSHYAPEHRLLLFEEPTGAAEAELSALSQRWPVLPNLPPEAQALILLAEPTTTLAQELKSAGLAYWALSERGDLNEIARQLFAVLRQADQSGAELILAECPQPGPGLRHAIRDRLRKAAGL